ncbi:MAG: hypothetical protein FJX76_02115 [Armatimonadetes bacterium]|nr:hypothetical protein [Armatimonadota bacterium]
MKRLLALLMLLAACRPVGATDWEKALPVIVRLEDARDLSALVVWTRDENPRVRARAVRAIGRAQSGDLAAVRARLLDKEAPVRAEAVFALGQQWSARAEGALVSVARAAKSREEHLLALEGLGKCAAPGDTGERLLVAALASREPLVRAVAARSLGVMAYRMKMLDKKPWKPDRTLMKRLRQLLADKNPTVRCASAYAMYRLGWGGFAARAAAPDPALLRLLADRDDTVRIVALQALAETTAAGALPAAALAAVLRGKDWRARVAAVDTLGKAGGEGADEALVLALHDPHALVVVAALRAAAAHKTEASAAILELWRNPTASEMVRAEALRVLPALSAGGADEVRAAATDANWRYRRAAAQALASLGDITLVDALLADSDPRVRAAAAESLGDSKGTAERLLRALADPDMVVRATAAEALGKRGDRNAVPLLIETLQSLSSAQDGEVMMAIVDALGEIRDPRAEDILVRLVADPDVSVGEHSEKALRALGKPYKGPRPMRPRAAPPSDEALKFLLQAPLKAAKGKPTVAVVTTTRGDLRIRLMVDEAPLTAWNFISLARKKYYDGITFHRVVPNFVVQGGDPRGDGWGGPGRTIRCEYNPQRYRRGMVGMALAGKDTGGSQWFVTHSPQPHLNGRFTIFGRLEAGGEVLDALTEGDQIISVKIIAP